MAEQLPDTISIVWSIEDIQSQDETITDDQAREILQMLDNGHDATQGINWDVIDATIDSYKSGSRSLATMWRLNQ